MHFVKELIFRKSEQELTCISQIDKDMNIFRIIIVDMKRVREMDAHS